MIKLVIFDLSDVCFTAEEAPFLREFAKNHNLQFEELNTFYQSLLLKSETDEITGTDVWNATLKRFKIKSDPNSIITEMMKLKKAHEEVLAIVKAVRQKAKTAYITNYNKDYWSEITKIFVMQDYFDEGIVSYMVKARKPAHKGFLELMKKYAAKPTETIFIDDSEKNLNSAAELGIHTIKFKSPGQLTRSLQNMISLSIEFSVNDPEMPAQLLHQIKNEEFYPQGGEAKLVYVLPPHKSFLTMRKVYEVSYPLSITYCENGYMDVFVHTKSAIVVKKYFLERQRENRNFINNVESDWKAAHDIFLKTINKIREKSLKELSIEQLIKLFKEITQNGEDVWNYLIFIDAFDNDGAAFIKAEVEKTDRALTNEIGTLTHAGEMSYTQQEKLALLRMALVIEKKCLTNQFLKADAFEELSNEVKQLLMKHHEQFYWYKNNHASINNLTQQDFFEELKELFGLHSKESIENQLHEIVESHQEQIRKRDQLLHQLPKESQNLLYFFRKMTELRDHRKGTQCIMVTWMKILLQHLAEKTGISLELLENIAYWEVEDILNNKERLVGKLTERNKGVLTIASDEYGMLFFTGEEATKIKKMLEESIMKGKSELIGRPAYMGTAMGTVKIINKVADFKKFKEGDVLVSSMTRPEMVPIMKKAAAIVTDEGGITCHAAIVSRELKIPCIVGTEIATKTLKDGMKVKVDAHAGLIHIIQQ